MRYRKIDVQFLKSMIRLEKWFPLQGERVHSLKFLYVVRMYVTFQKQNRKEKEEKETKQQQQPYKFTQSYNILHRLQVHHLSLTFIMHNKCIYINTYIATYIHMYIHTYIQL